MTVLQYSTQGYGLSLNTSQIPLIVKPLSQVYGDAVDVLVDPLNQGGVDLSPSTAPVPNWTSFSQALDHINDPGNDPNAFLATRLQAESPQVVATVQVLLEGVK